MAVCAVAASSPVRAVTRAINSSMAMISSERFQMSFDSGAAEIKRAAGVLEMSGRLVHNGA